MALDLNPAALTSQCASDVGYDFSYSAGYTVNRSGQFTALTGSGRVLSFTPYDDADLMRDNVMRVVRADGGSIYESTAKAPVLKCRGVPGAHTMVSECSSGGLTELNWDVVFNTTGVDRTRWFMGDSYDIFTALPFLPFSKSYLMMGVKKNGLSVDAIDGLEGWMIDVNSLTDGQMWMDSEWSTSYPAMTGLGGRFSCAGGNATLNFASPSRTKGLVVTTAMAWDTSVSELYLLRKEASAASAVITDATITPLNFANPFFGFRYPLLAEMYGFLWCEWDGALPADWQTAVETMSANWQAGDKSIYEGWRP